MWRYRLLWCRSGCKVSYGVRWGGGFRTRANYGTSSAPPPTSDRTLGEIEPCYTSFTLLFVAAMVAATMWCSHALQSSWNMEYTVGDAIPRLEMLLAMSDACSTGLQTFSGCFKS